MHKSSLEATFTAEEVVNMLYSSFTGADISDDDLEMDWRRDGKSKRCADRSN